MYVRQIGDQTLTFGVSGMLWRENLIMYDRQTLSWWAQATGKAIDGKLKGGVLGMYPEASMMTWAEWRKLHPNTLVLTKLTASGLEGMSTRYREYHESSRLGVTGRLRVRDRTLPPKSLVVGFLIDDEPLTVDMTKLKAKGRAVATSQSGKRFEVAATAQGGGAQVFLLDTSTGLRTTHVPASFSYWFAWKAFFPSARLIEP